MKTNQNLRRFGEKKGSNNKISHAEFTGGAPRTSASSTHAVVVNDNNMRGRFRIKFGMTIDNNRAFTLIELLVVVLIIGILASVALPQYQKAVMKARFVQALTVFNAYSKAIDLWVVENGWPTERFNFTGDDSCNGGGTLSSLDIAMEPTERKGCGDVVGTLAVQAYIKSNIAVLVTYPMNQDTCYAQFQRQSGATAWNLAAIKYKGKDDSSGSTATADQCKDYQRMVCQYWSTEGTGLGRNPSIEQCARFGITLTKSE